MVFITRKTTTRRIYARNTALEMRQISQSVIKTTLALALFYMATLMFVHRLAAAKQKSYTWTMEWLLGNA